MFPLLLHPLYLLPLASEAMLHFDVNCPCHLTFHLIIMSKMHMLGESVSKIKKSHESRSVSFLSLCLRKAKGVRFVV